MNLLLEDKEIAQFLASIIDYTKFVNDVPEIEKETAGAVYYIIEKKEKDHVDKFRPKLKQRLLDSVGRDLQERVELAQLAVNVKRDYYLDLFHKHINYFINKLGEDTVLNLYRKSKKQEFVKSTGLHLDSNAVLMRRKHYNNYETDCLFRNMEGNENMLITKMNNNWPFWFIDTGYTNFLNGKKKIWHRLVRNNLHHSDLFNAPVDRLGIFEKFPAPWRKDGEIILIIEPGGFSAKTFDIDIKKWKYDVERELRQYTDKKIKFRPKASKKIRTNLYQELLNDDYYCVVNINSNAATESLWAGVPAITLHRHITNSVTRNKLSDINDLYRPNLANWLSMLSYSQFTYEELINGQAAKIVREYHV